jgi:hypothetical protein
MRHEPYKPPYTVPEVLRLRTEGRTYRQIARHFGISGSRVGQIIERERQRAFSAERSAAIRAGIRAGNDIARKLPIDDLLCVLSLPKRAESVLKECLQRIGIEAFSLLDMMEFLIPVVERPRELLDAMPAYRVRLVGQILYADMIRGMSAVDCGESLRAEWADRRRRLREYLVGTGGRYPYILHGKCAALRPDA